MAGMLRPNLRRPIFLVGAPRSGTTFLGRCLQKVPEISYHFEPAATKAAARRVYEGNWGRQRGARFYRAVYRWLLRLHFDGDLRFAEKTPRNAFLIPFLRSTFPDAVFVHIVRDGRDAALSWSEKPWLQGAQADAGRIEPGGYPYGPYPRFWVEPDRAKEFRRTSDIHRCIWGWRRHVEAALHAASTLPTRQVHEIRYERLVAEPRREAGRLLDFLAIRDAASRAAFNQAVKEASPRSIGRWRGVLSDDDLLQIEEEAGVLLRRLGYVG